MSSTDFTYLGTLGLQDSARIALFIVVVATSYYVGTAIYSVYFGPLAKFPGPKIYAFSQIPRLSAQRGGREHLVGKALHEQYGPIVRTGPRDLSFMTGGQAWRDIYGFSKPGQPKIGKNLELYNKSLNGAPSLITADDASHARQRKIISHAFSDRALKEQEPLLRQWTAKLVEKLSSFAASGDRVDLLKMYNCTTFDIMGDLAFNEGLNMLEGGEYSPWVKTIFAGIKADTRIRAIRNLSWVTKYIFENFIKNNPTIRKESHEHFRYTADRVDRRLQMKPDRPDLWTRILAKNADEGGLSLAEHKSNASLLMIAGTETTATALSGLTYHLGMNPEVFQKLKTEIRTEVGSEDGLHLENLARLKYVHACLQEAMRMYPPVPLRLPRIVPAGGAVICGEYVPGGTTVGVPQWATYRSAEHFKNPLKFAPERWLGDPEYAGDHRDAMEPFSLGPRNCLGKNLAWHEMRLILCHLLLRFDVELAPEAANWDEQEVYTLWDKKPLICTLSPVS